MSHKPTAYHIHCLHHLHYSEYSSSCHWSPRRYPPPRVTWSNPPLSTLPSKYLVGCWDIILIVFHCSKVHLLRLLYLDKVVLSNNINDPRRFPLLPSPLVNICLKLSSNTYPMAMCNLDNINPHVNNHYWDIVSSNVIATTRIMHMCPHIDNHSPTHAHENMDNANLLFTYTYLIIYPTT